MCVYVQILTSVLQRTALTVVLIRSAATFVLEATMPTTIHVYVRKLTSPYTRDGLGNGIPIADGIPIKCLSHAHGNPMGIEHIPR